MTPEEREALARERYPRWARAYRRAYLNFGMTAFVLVASGLCAWGFHGFFDVAPVIGGGGALLFLAASMVWYAGYAPKNKRRAHGQGQYVEGVLESVSEDRDGIFRVEFRYPDKSGEMKSDSDYVDIPEAPQWIPPDGQRAILGLFRLEDGVFLSEFPVDSAFPTVIRTEAIPAAAQGAEGLVGASAQSLNTPKRYGKQRARFKSSHGLD